MPNITHTRTRPSSPKTKLLVVRQPVKSVRREHDGDRLPIRLALGVITAAGVIAAVWLMGYLGYRLGFAPLVGVRDLVGEPGLGLATGTMMLISIPRVILQAGLDQPMWLMLAFVLIAIPAGGLAAARPLTPGGPRMKQAVMIMASIAAAASLINGTALLWWTTSPIRSELIRPLPALAADATRWYDDIQTVAGLDVLAVIVAALWVVLVMRLPVQMWLKALTTSSAMFALVVVTVSMSISNAAAAQIGADRSLCVLDDVATPRVMLGSTPHHMTTLVVYDERIVVELRNHPDAISVDGRQSIVRYLEDRADAAN